MDNGKHRDQTTDNMDGKLRIMEIVETEMEQQKGEAIFCLMFFICIISIWILLVALWDMLDRPIIADMMTYGIELIAIIVLVVILKFTRLDIRKMGITAKNLRPSLKRAALISVTAVALMIALKIAIKPGQPVFNWTKYDYKYVVTSVLQEFLARGFFLTTLLYINTKKNGRHIAVICSSLMFACLHLYYGFYFMMGAGILSVILGYCYLKDENIWGVSLIHFMFGTAGFVLEII